MNISFFQKVKDSCPELGTNFEKISQQLFPSSRSAIDLGELFQKHLEKAAEYFFSKQYNFKCNLDWASYTPLFLTTKPNEKCKNAYLIREAWSKPERLRGDLVITQVFPCKKEESLDDICISMREMESRDINVIPSIFHMSQWYKEQTETAQKLLSEIPTQTPSMQTPTSESTQTSTMSATTHDLDVSTCEISDNKTLSFQINSLPNFPPRKTPTPAPGSAQTPSMQEQTPWAPTNFFNNSVNAEVCANNSITTLPTPESVQTPITLTPTLQSPTTPTTPTPTPDPAQTSSSSTLALKYVKIGLGSCATVFFTYQAYKEAIKWYKATDRQAKQSPVSIAATDASNARKRTLAYSVGAVASCAFTLASA